MGFIVALWHRVCSLKKIELVGIVLQINPGILQIPETVRGFDGRGA